MRVPEFHLLVVFVIQDHDVVVGCPVHMDVGVTESHVIQARMGEETHSQKKRTEFEQLWFNDFDLRNIYVRTVQIILCR